MFGYYSSINRINFGDEEYIIVRLFKHYSLEQCNTITSFHCSYGFLHIRGGLTYMDMRPPTDYEINKYDHVIFTSDVACDRW